MKTHQTLTCVLFAAFIAVTPVALHADMVDTPSILASEQGYVQGGGLLQSAQSGSLIAREEVRYQLESLGVSPSLAAERVDAMTDSQLQQLAFRLEEMPAGGNAALGVVVTVLVILLLLEILGVTDIFNKV